MTDITENELICERLLGWERWREPGKQLQWKNVIDGGRGWTIEETPSFATWAEAGLILDWLTSHIGPGLEGLRDELALKLRARKLTPAAIRSAVLEYIKLSGTEQR